MMVIHKRNAKGTKDEVYIGRPSKWGNPFVIGKDGTRREVIEKFRVYANRRFTPEDLKELKGKTLVCWCSPQACHGDVLVELVKELDHPFYEYFFAR